MLLGIDIGTTNSKAGLFAEDGAEIKVASRSTEAFQHENGYWYYDPEHMWATVVEVIREAMEGAPEGSVQAIGITSMAESGLFVDPDTGKAVSPFMPWFDAVTSPQADQIKSRADLAERFEKIGLHLSFKHGLAKMLWVREHAPEALERGVWLSAAGYVAYRLTGSMAVDYSLAARTYGFRIDTKEWDWDWLAEFGFERRHMPEAVPSATTVGRVRPETAEQLGLAAGAAVSVSGHDHVCAALAVGAIRPGIIYDSMGTAETLVGTMAPKKLGAKEYASGLSYGLHVAGGDRMFWMGGNASSGGSVEWLRGMLDEPELDYDRMRELLDGLEPEPTGILYYPYLTGSGAPLPNASVRGAWIGLDKGHGRAELIRSVLEGTAYQLESIRREAEEIVGNRIETLIVVGGGTKNAHWLQIKADVLNCRLDVPPLPQATMLGAALVAGIASGAYASPEEAAKAVAGGKAAQVHPDPARHERYHRLYETGYLHFQEALRTWKR